MKQPEYVRGALITSHAHDWEYVTGRAYCTGQANLGRFYQAGFIYSAIVWTRKRRYTKP